MILGMENCYSCKKSFPVELLPSTIVLGRIVPMCHDCKVRIQERNVLIILFSQIGDHLNAGVLSPSCVYLVLASVF